MRNYDVIKRMSIEEMAAVFYMFLKPMMDAFGISEGTRERMREYIRGFLAEEVAEKK